MSNQIKPRNYQNFIAWAYDSTQNLIHINQANSGANGYYCPVCSGELIAKKGSKNAHHFAHKDGMISSHESVLHYVAKHITAGLIRSGSFQHTKKYQLYFDSISHYSEDTLTLFIDRPLLKTKFTDIEKAFSSSIIPDVTTNSDIQNEKIAIEIFVTNKKTASDISKFKYENLSVLEINLSGLPFDVGYEVIEREIKNQNNQKWLFLSETIYPEQKNQINTFLANRQNAKRERLFNDKQIMISDLLMDIDTGNIVKHLTSAVDLTITSITKPLFMKSQGLWMGEVKVNEKTCMSIVLVDREFCSKKIDNFGRPFFMREHTQYDVNDYWINTGDWKEKAIKKYGDSKLFKLNVSYEDREAAKTLGATWFPTYNSWFTTSRSEQERIQRLLDILKLDYEP